MTVHMVVDYLWYVVTKRFSSAIEEGEGVLRSMFIGFEGNSLNRSYRRERLGFYVLMG